MASPPRIIAADSFTSIAGIVRATLDLVRRPAVVIDVRSAADALAEVKRGDVAVVVANASMSDMSGIDFATKVAKQAKNTPIIVLADASSPQVDADIIEAAPCHYLVREQDGFRFIRLLVSLLDGDVPAEEVSAPAVVEEGPSLGPVPKVSVTRLAEKLNSTLTDVGAMAIVLVDRTGKILHETGAVGYLDRDKLTGTLAPIFSKMIGIGPLVGGSKPAAMHFYDGDEFDIFALALGLHHFICLIFEGSAGSRAFGAVTMFGRRAVAEMLDVIGDAAFEVRIPEPVVEAPAKAPVDKKRETKEIKPVVKPPEPEYVPQRPPSLEPLPEDADLETVLEGLEGLDLSEADVLFDPEKLAEIAAKLMAGERLTFEEAQQMGVLQK